jgi:hypothetical protein
LEQPEGKRPSRSKPNASPWVKAFVWFHLAAVTVWCIPMGSQELQAGQVRPRGSDYLILANDRYLRTSPIKYYTLATGFWQYWDMFAPNPTYTDIWCDAEVLYRNGRQRRYQYPRMALLSIPDKYVEQRYRKFFERVNDPRNSFLWPAFAQWIALQCDDDPRNPPVTVRLHSHWQMIPAPGQPPPEGYRDRVFFVYSVDQADLAKQEGAW